ncbi:MAG: UDP-3-O-(3-hydroxymyristoyl)glucosamine N-acyltransferase [Bacteriovoracaceae bacterium]|nr:UDP-3-O-(3-hydroxymyristoyl)glucosamine N-acyltransferase [Bacteriovoracaceae bacterium]
MTITCGDIREQLSDLIDDFCGDQNKVVAGVNSPASASLDDIVTIVNPKYLPKAIASKAQVLMISPTNFSSLKEEDKENKHFFISKNPELLMTKALELFFAPKYLSGLDGSIHSTAQISQSAKIGSSVSIGPNVVIGENVVIGDHTQIGANCVIDQDVTIGKSCRLFPTVYIARDCIIGEDCQIQAQTVVGSTGYGYSHDHQGKHYRIYHQGKVILEDRVDIGACCAIDRGTIDNTIIRSGSKLDNFCHVAHNADIGIDCLITAGFIMAGSTTIGNRFVCGGRTSVGGHLTITDDVTCAALTTINGHHPKPGKVGGFPPVPLNVYIRNRAATAHLADMRRSIGKLMKKVFPDT